MEKSIYLVLENGEIFKGKSFGAYGSVTGELVFTTAMTGYLETLTDPSYFGQIVVQTFPLIGNYGVIPSDFESDKVGVKAYIVKQLCQEPSNYRSEGALDIFLKEHNIVGISGLDTRQLTKLIRENGVMNAKIITEPETDGETLEEIRSYKVVDAVPSVTCAKAFTDQAEQEKFHVVLWDFGAKKNIRRSLMERGCTVTTVPASSTAEEIAALKPDGVMLSNGPGDPADNPTIIEELKKLCQKKLPMFGICLGHQLLALSQGGKTFKLRYGHRGANQPVIDTRTQRVYVTSQNHGYAVSEESLPPNGEILFINANDKTCEGMVYRDMPAFSAQFHPEAAAGPKDTAFLFDQFISMMEEGKKHAQK